MGKKKINLSQVFAGPKLGVTNVVLLFFGGFMRFFLGIILFSLSLVLTTVPAYCAQSASDDLSTLQKIWGDKEFLHGQLIPLGFVKAAEAAGDLNGDGIDDVVIILHKAPKEKKISPDEIAETEMTPQAIAIFSGEKTGKFKLWKLGLHHFIDSGPNLMDRDGIGELEIKKGVLMIGSSIAISMGGWSSGGCTQKWRNSSSGFQLIGLTIVDIDRHCACGTTQDTNLLTGNTVLKTDRDRDGNQMSQEKIKNKEPPQKRALGILQL